MKIKQGVMMENITKKEKEGIKQIAKVISFQKEVRDKNSQLKSLTEQLSQKQSHVRSNYFLVLKFQNQKSLRVLNYLLRG